MTMRLTIIGSGDAFGSGGRFNTCFFLETAKGTLLVDCGASSLVALKARGVDPNAIDGIVLSHLHGDHFFQSPYLDLSGEPGNTSGMLAIAHEVVESLVREYKPTVPAKVREDLKNHFRRKAEKRN